MKKDMKKEIDNRKLIEPYHEERLKEVSIDVDFVVVPKYVYIPLSKWYPCNKEIKRQVIKWRHQQRKLISKFNKKQGRLASSMTMSTLNYQHQGAEFIYELELFPKFIYFA